MRSSEEVPDVGGIERLLRERYGQPRHHNPLDPLDDVIFVLLSRMTQEVKYLRTYQSLRSALPTWEAVADAPIETLEGLLVDAGLASTKSRHIKQLLQKVIVREGSMDLSSLRNMSDDAVEEYLTSLPGVGGKTARCVMMYTLGRAAFPVDAHVWRVSGRLGLAADSPCSDKRARDLEARIPPNLRASLHMTLIAHGRETCTALRPRCNSCVLSDLCPSRE